MNWKTDRKCCKCKNVFHKDLLVDGALCSECFESNKTEKLQAKHTQLVTKKNPCKCSKCTLRIGAGEIAYRVKINLLHGNDYNIYFHKDCVELI